jgi:hypothetical protein
MVCGSSVDDAIMGICRPMGAEILRGWRLSVSAKKVSGRALYDQAAANSRAIVERRCKCDAYSKRPIALVGKSLIVVVRLSLTDLGAGR